MTQPAVSPYLTVKGAKAAISWYEKIFGAECTATMLAEDNERIMHATVLIGGAPVMLSDEFAEFSPFRGPEADPPSPVAISIRFGSPGEVDHVYNLAIANGARSSWPPEDMFWGDRFCQIIDPFNHRWMLAAVLPEKR